MKKLVKFTAAALSLCVIASPLTAFAADRPMVSNLSREKYQVLKESWADSAKAAGCFQGGIVIIGNLNCPVIPLPGDKEEPEIPENPGSPENPDEPGTPEQPDTPETPEQPDVPEIPESPEQPDIPETPENPEQPDIPETPESPDQPGTPDEPGTPDKPNPPEQPDTPEDGEDNGELSFAQRVVDLVNQERAEEGLSALAIDSKMENAAMTRAREIQSSFSHTRPDGSSFSTALNAAGVTYRTVGENIAWGQKTPEAVVEGWMNSPGHRANIMSRNFGRIGVGHLQNGNGVSYWVQLFAD